MRKHILAITYICFLCSSCMTMYRPNMQNTPSFENKGDIRATLNTQNAQFAYAALNHWGFVADGFYNISKTTEGSVNFKVINRIIRNNFDIAACYFFNDSEDNSIEILAGGGIGNSNYYSSDNITIYNNLNQYNLFVQPNVVLNRHFVFSTRLRYVNFHIEKQNLNENKIITKDVMIEPAFTSRFGKNGFYFKMQVQASIPYKVDLENDELFNIMLPKSGGGLFFKYKFIFGIALELKIDEIIKHRKQNKD